MKANEQFDLQKMSSMKPDELKRYIQKLYKENRGPIQFGYARVSTSGQARDGFSLESQEEQLRDAGAEIIFREVYTGTTSARPEMENLLNALRAGDTVIVTKLDRLARNTVDGERLVELMIQKNVSLRILNMGVIDDSPLGKVIRQIFFAFAEFERNMIVERTQEGKALAKLDPNFKEGRPKKFTAEQIGLALELLNTHSYSAVVKMTGISKATLIRAKRESQSGTQMSSSGYDIVD